MSNKGAHYLIAFRVHADENCMDPEDLVYELVNQDCPFDHSLGVLGVLDLKTGLYESLSHSDECKEFGYSVEAFNKYMRGYLGSKKHRINEMKKLLSEIHDTANWIERVTTEMDDPQTGINACIKLSGRANMLRDALHKIQAGEKFDLADPHYTYKDGIYEADVDDPILVHNDINVSNGMEPTHIFYVDLEDEGEYDD